MMRRHPMQSFLLEIFLSGMIVDVFLITENLRNTSVRQSHAKPLYDPKLWSNKERERERERERDIKTLGPHCHAISSDWAERSEAFQLLSKRFQLLSKRCGCHARWLYRRTDRSLGAVAGRLAVSWHLQLHYA